jgi:hypothetical protein
MFGEHAIAFTDPVLSREIVTGEHESEFSIELVVSVPDKSQEGVPFLLLLTNGDASSQLLLGQWWHSLIVMSGTDFRNERRAPRITVDVELFMGMPIHLVITSGPDGTTLFLNGELIKDHPDLLCQQFKGANPSRLVLGNSLHGTNPWQGIISGFAMFPGRMTPTDIQSRFLHWQSNGSLAGSDSPSVILQYSFAEALSDRMRDISSNAFDLWTPASQAFVEPAFCENPFTDFRWDYSFQKDVLLNLFGFIPFGAAFAFALNQRNSPSGLKRLLIILTAGCLLSLFIEIVQAWIPTRTSSGLDWILNTIGTALGLVAFRFLQFFWNKRPPTLYDPM